MEVLKPKDVERLEMELSFRTLKEYSMTVKDRKIGQIEDVVFDLQSHSIYYVFVELQHWLPGQKLLISPDLINNVRASERTIVFSLAEEQLKNSPGLPTTNSAARMPKESKPVVRNYFSWARYMRSLSSNKTNVGEKKEERRLFLMKTILGIHVCNTDTTLGHLEDFIVNVARNEVTYMMIDREKTIPTPGENLIIPLDWVECINPTEIMIVARDPKSDCRLYSESHPLKWTPC